MDEIDKKEWYEMLSLADTKSIIKANLSTAARSFIAIGYCLKHIKDQELYLEDGYETIWDLAKAEFGISKSTASRYMSMNDRFSKDGNSPLVKEQYREFNKSQLQEMLSLTEKQIESVTPDITVQKLREMRSPKEIPYFEIEGQLELEEDFPETIPDMPQENQIPLKQSFTMDITELLDEEPEGEAVAISQQSEHELVPEPNIDESTCPPYDNHSCRRQEWGLKPEEQEIGRKECAKCWADWKVQQKLLNAAKVQQEELTPIERGCITGLSPHGNCVCCGADGVKCCGQCDKDCNGRCGWLDEQETEQPVPKMEYELRGKYCDAAARKLIESKHEWFAADHMNRVLQVNESEKQLKEQLVGKEAWYFMDPYGNGIAHMNLFQDYIQFFDGNSWVGECEWFYLCAAIQGMWNVIVIEKAQAEQPAPMGPGKEEKLPDESWNIGELPQAKEKHLKQLAKKLVERLGSKIVLDEMSSIPSEETIEKATWQLGRMEPGGIELQDGAVAYACQGIIEFFRGEEDLGVCSYARFATQARKALSEWSDQVPGESQEAEPEEDEQKPEVIDAEFSEVNELGDDYLTDLQIAQRELERANRLLEKCLRDLPDETNISIRGMKLKVAALASFICDLDDIENPPPKPEQPELPLLKNNDQRAAFVDAYESWPIWIETEETGERYYRYDLQDGTSMVVKVYHAMLFDYNHTFDGKWEDRFTEGYGCHEYYLLKPDKFFWECKTNRSVLIDKLKEIQKKG